MNKRNLLIGSLIPVAVLGVAFGSIVQAQSASGLTEVLRKARIFPPSSGARATLVGRQAVIEVFHNSADAFSRRKAAINAARALVNYAAG